MGVLTRIWYFLLFVLIIELVLYDNIWWVEYEQRIEGVERDLQLFGKITSISRDYFYLYTGSSTIRIESLGMPKVKKAKYGETVVHVLLRKDGTIEGVDYHNYDYNYFLYFLSFISLVIFLILFFKEWRLTSRGFENA